MEYVMDECGNRRTWKDNKLHSYNDLPAVIYKDGTQCWYKDGIYHRDNDMPALICKNGYAVWYIDGKLIKICLNYSAFTRIKRVSH